MGRDIESKFGYQIGLVAHLIHNESNERLAKYDMTVAQARVLYILMQHGPMTQGELQQQLYVKASTMNGIVESLLNKRLIEKNDCENDKRSKIIILTEKGKLVDEQIWRDMEGLEKEVLAGFSNEEIALLKLWLQRVKGNVCQVKKGGS